MTENWRKTEKLEFLAEKRNIDGIKWKMLQPDDRNRWLTEGTYPEFATFLSIGSKATKDLKGIHAETIFQTYSLGINTARDVILYDFSHQNLEERIIRFIDSYNAEVSRWIVRGKPKDIDNFVYYDKVKWSEHLKNELKREKYGKFDNNLFRIALYRPFCKMWLYYNTLFIDRPALFNKIFPTLSTETENVAICLTDLGSEKPFMALVTNIIPDLHLVSSGCGTQTFPYYTYAEDGSNRRENITDWALAQFQAKYGSEMTKWDIFHYVYGMLHHPAYRERYAENLKRDLPRLPLLATREQFETCVRIGKRLMELHLHYEEVQGYPLTWIEKKDVPITWRVEKMRLNATKETLAVNDWLTLTDIPEECSQYRLGNRSALEWIIDQYRVSTDARSGIVSDPNREDDEQYIVHLVEKVVTVSVETVKLVKELAEAVKQEDWLGEASVEG